MKSVSSTEAQNIHGGLLIATVAGASVISSTNAGLLLSAAATATLTLGATALNYGLEKLGHWLD
jgi:hypothetical protein